MPGKRGWGKGDGERDGRRPRAGMEGRKGKSSITWTKATRILCRRIALSSLGLSRIRTLRTRIRTLETLEPEPCKPRSKSDNRKFDFSNLAVCRPRKKENDKDR